MIKAKCIYCGQTVTAPDGMNEKMAKCPKCGRSFRLKATPPSPKEAPSQPASRDASPACVICGRSIAKQEAHDSPDGFICPSCHAVLNQLQTTGETRERRAQEKEAKAGEPVLRTPVTIESSGSAAQEDKTFGLLSFA